MTPDIVFVLADDLDLRSVDHLPRLRSQVAEPGATFSEALVSLSICCPSRATMLTGKYAHNTGVIRNEAPNGGWAAFHRKEETTTVGTALQSAGYRTGLFGKYLNGYPGDDPSFVPPGWTTWAGGADHFIYRQYGYTLNEDGRTVHYGRQPEDYLTDVIAEKVKSFLRASDTPAFAWVAPTAPHNPQIPAKRHFQRFMDLPFPRTPNFDEDDVTDKGPDVQVRNLLSPREHRDVADRWRRRLASMLAVEDLIQGIIDTQTARGRLQDTWIVFTSDNGYHLGEHRLTRGKETEFEEDLRVPLYVRGPGVQAGSRLDAMVLNTDIGPTLAAMGGTTLPEADGRSWLPWLVGPTPTTWRDAVLIERWHEPEQEDEGGRAARPILSAYQGIRTHRWKYVEMEDGFRELFDLKNDPYELENVLGNHPDEVAVLSKRLDKLRNCQGETCRAAEDP